ncbi:hypothetical protein B0H14DRAFT_2612131 [Mycena olivaceomarginata]|nr:hypothetical protein B0H14DRAFT_2612131 [Mycena olivaceomarginata]
MTFKLFSAVIGFSSAVKLCLMLLPLSSGTVEPGQQSSALLPPNSLSSLWILILLHRVTIMSAFLDVVVFVMSPQLATALLHRSACRVLCQDFESAADMSKAVLSIILDANHKQISTESLLHVAAVLNISVFGDRNLRFKVRSVIGKHAQSVGTADTNAYSSTSITDFFNSFETHRKPDLLSIAALHHIQIPQSPTAGTQF